MIVSTIKKAMAVSFVLLLLSGCSAIESTMRFVTVSKNMSNEALQEVYKPGAIFDYSWASGKEGSIQFDKSGNASIQYGEKKDTGTWNIEDKMLCTTWQELGADEEQCYTVFRKWIKKDKFRLFNTDGSAHATAFLK